MRYLVFTLLALSFSVTASPIQSQTFECEYSFQKSGCYHDRVVPDRPLTIQMLNRRDPSSKVWDGELIDWNHYEETIYSLACKCAELTIKKGYYFFGLQFYGECWSGPLNHTVAPEPSENCIGVSYKPCVDGDVSECIGKAFTNYLYVIPQ